MSNKCPKGDPCPEGYRSTKWCPICIADTKEEELKQLDKVETQRKKDQSRGAPAKYTQTTDPTTLSSDWAKHVTTSPNANAIYMSEGNVAAGNMIETTTFGSVTKTYLPTTAPGPKLRGGPGILAIHDVSWALAADGITHPRPYDFHDIPGTLIDTMKPFRVLAKQTPGKFDGKCPICRGHTHVGQPIYGIERDTNAMISNLMWLCPVCAAATELAAWIPSFLQVEPQQVVLPQVWAWIKCLLVDHFSTNSSNPEQTLQMVLRYRHNKRTFCWEWVK